MTAYSNKMRDYMKLMESDYVGKQVDNPNVSYEVKKEKNAITKVTAQLSSYDSGKYTRLAQNFARMEQIALETVELQTSMKADMRAAFEPLFNAEETAYSRVIETVSFVMSLTKNPAPATTVRYSEVLKELEEHLTPELLTVLESIKAKYSKANESKPSSFSYKPKAGGVGDQSESVQESAMVDKMKSFFSKYLEKITQWGSSYDSKLIKLKKNAGMMISTSESMHEDASMTANVDPSAVASLLYAALQQSRSDLVPLDAPKGSMVAVKTANGSVFEISVKQIN